MTHSFIPEFHTSTHGTGTRCATRNLTHWLHKAVTSQNVAFACPRLRDVLAPASCGRPSLSHRHGGHEDDAVDTLPFFATKEETTGYFARLAAVSLRISLLFSLPVCGVLTLGAPDYRADWFHDGVDAGDWFCSPVLRDLRPLVCGRFSSIGLTAMDITSCACNAVTLFGKTNPPAMFLHFGSVLVMQLLVVTSASLMAPNASVTRKCFSVAACLGDTWHSLARCLSRLRNTGMLVLLGGSPSDSRCKRRVQIDMAVLEFRSLFQWCSCVCCQE